MQKSFEDCSLKTWVQLDFLIVKLEPIFLALGISLNSLNCFVCSPASTSLDQLALGRVGEITGLLSLCVAVAQPPSCVRSLRHGLKSARPLCSSTSPKFAKLCCLPYWTWKIFCLVQKGAAVPCKDKASKVIAASFLLDDEVFNELCDTSPEHFVEMLFLSNVVACLWAPATLLELVELGQQGFSVECGMFAFRWLFSCRSYG